MAPSGSAVSRRGATRWTAARRMLAVVLVVGAVARVWGIWFGLPATEVRPDETLIADTAIRHLRGDFRPILFDYPALYPAALAAVYAGYYWLGKPFTGHATLEAFAESRQIHPAPFLLLSRVLSAVMGTVTIWWLFVACRRLFDETTALVSATFLALCFLHARDSHFGTTDITLTALIVAAVLLVVRWQEERRGSLLVLAGVAAGLATAVKYNGIVLWAPFAVAALQRWLADGPSRRTTARLAVRILAFGVVFFGSFLLAAPYTVLDWDRFVLHMTTLHDAVATGGVVRPASGWWHHATFTLPIALGWPLYVAGLCGVAGLLGGRSRRHLTWFAFPVAYFVVAGSGRLVFVRYMLPVVPFLVAAAGAATTSGVRRVLAGRPARVQAVAIAIVAALLAAPSAVNVVAVDRLLARTDNRVATARALLRDVPEGGRVYQSGREYGHVPLLVDGVRLKLWNVSFEPRPPRFRPQPPAGSPLPEWILLQRSPLVGYSRIAPEIVELIGEHYTRVRVFEAHDERPGRVYDQDDAFYLPLRGFGGIARPGPNFELYRRVTE